MIMTNILAKFAVAAAFATMVGGAASAATLGYATGVSQTGGPGASFCGVQTADNDRTNICNALGAPDGDFPSANQGFVSLGNFQNLEFTFANNFTGPITIWEVTGSSGPFGEALDGMAFFAEGIGGDMFEGVVSGGGTPVAGTTSRYEITFGGDLTNVYSRLIVSVDADGLQTPDGFDIDAVAAQVVPLPAAAWMLIAGVGALAGLKRRKKA
jgi:hypothetical protein